MAELTHQIITEKLKGKFGEVILNVEEPYKFLTITVKREKILDILTQNWALHFSLTLPEYTIRTPMTSLALSIICITCLKI